MYPDARLFRDREVLNAVHSGKVEMAVPGTWNLELYVPDLALFLLPVFYGRTPEENHSLSDGPVGQKIQQKMETLYDVRVPGRWMDLGYAHVFTLGKPITKWEDFRGLRIRVAGGKGNELRLAGLGSHSFTIPWSELVERLQGKMLDGLLTTYETIRSAELWKYGVRYAFEDRQYFPMYLPLVNKQVWDSLELSERTAFRTLWNRQAKHQREEASQAQMQAKEAFIQEGGGQVVQPSPTELHRIRTVLQRLQPAFLKQLRIDESLVLDAEKELEL